MYKSVKGRELGNKILDILLDLNRRDELWKAKYDDGQGENFVYDCKCVGNEFVIWARLFYDPINSDDKDSFLVTFPDPDTVVVL